MLLDRFGPRRVEPVLLAVGGHGRAAVRATRRALPGLVVARALIGAGVAVCLMAPLKAIAAWVPRERQASFAGWMMTAGSAGRSSAATPTEFALRFVHWRTLFVALALTTFVVAAWIWWRVPDTREAGRRTGLAAQWAGVRKCSRIRGSGGSRRSRAAAPARSSRSRGSGRCRGSPRSTATIAASRRGTAS